MQVRERSAELGKVIGFHAKPMFFRGFDRELTKAREWARNRVRSLLLLNLFERDPPDSIRANRLLLRGRCVTLELARGNIAQLSLATYCIRSLSGRPYVSESPKPSHHVFYQILWRPESWILSHRRPRQQSHNGDGDDSQS